MGVFPHTPLVAGAPCRFESKRVPVLSHPPSPKFNRLLPEVLLSLASPPTAGGGDLLSRLPRRLGYLHALPTPGLQGGIVSPIIRPRLS